MNQSIIQTDESRCVGCNKCVAKCPVHANSAIWTEHGIKIHIDPNRCIACGECIHVCDHEARSYTDDTEQFFNDLQNGKKISILAAPAIRHNIPQYLQLFTWLRQQSVHLIYDVSFGADITTWAYLKAIQEQNLTSIIAQPCPALVTYIQRYKPELLNQLAPVHSPVLCTAIYLHHYKQESDNLAFLSPCIAKTLEFQDSDTNEHISYNVTYPKLMDYLKRHNINLNSFPPSDFNNIPCGVGLAYSRPGGLRENVEFHTGNSIWIRQIEGSENLYPYLDQYAERIKRQKPVPVLVDALNCAHGCNLGTASCTNADLDDIDAHMNKLKEEKAAKEESRRLFKYFDDNLQLEDFTRHYTAAPLPKDEENNKNLESVFQILGKTTPESRKINCYSCGYGNCHKFAQAVASGHNCVEACVYYARNRLHESNDEFNEMIQEVISYLNSLSLSADELKKGFTTLDNIAQTIKIIAFNANIEAARAGQHGITFGAVGKEIRNLSDQSKNVINQLHEQEQSMTKRLNDVESALNNMKEKMQTILH